MVEERNRELAPTTTGTWVHIPAHEEWDMLRPIDDTGKLRP